MGRVLLTVTGVAAAVIKMLFSLTLSSQPLKWSYTLNSSSDSSSSLMDMIYVIYIKVPMYIYDRVSAG